MTGDKETRSTMAYGHLSDIEVADKVRMLMRHDLNHESIVVAARDRIMYLSQQLQKWKDLAEEAACCSTKEEATKMIDAAFEEEAAEIAEYKHRCGYDSGRVDTPRRHWKIRHVLNGKDVEIKVLDDLLREIPIKHFTMVNDSFIKVDMGEDVTGMWVVERKK